ncbi:MAG: hypothetical protein HGGPFJEG_01038 [Ignavibacteria bacterium]|nr:hypothetical protein [Ignavibacteria bacterium]
MKNFFKAILLALVMIIFPLSDLFSQNVLKDDFNYAPIDSIDGTGGWVRSGANSPYNLKVVSPGLSYTGYAGSGIGNTLYFTNQGEGDIIYHNFSAPISSGAVYMSFMIRIDSLPSTMTQGYCISFNPISGGTSLNTRLYIKRLTGNTFNFGVYKSNSTSFSSSVFNSNVTYLAVLKYSFVNGNNNDSAKLYIFNSAVPSNEPSTPTAFRTDSIDYSGQNRVYISNNYAQSGLRGCSIKLDGIRIGNSWSTSILSSVNLLSSEIPQSFSLRQNYPNPFNPSTKIAFDIPEKSQVKLAVFDVLGNEVKTLVNEIQQAGSYEVDFTSTGLPSGIYFYRLETKNNIISKSMILVK